MRNPSQYVLALAILAAGGCRDAAEDAAAAGARARAGRVDALMEEARRSCGAHDYASARRAKEEIAAIEPESFAADAVERMVAAEEEREAGAPFEPVQVAAVIEALDALQRSRNAGGVEENGFLLLPAEHPHSRFVTSLRAALGGPSAWPEGTSLDLHRGQLMMRQSKLMHARLARLLAEVRSARASR